MQINKAVNGFVWGPVMLVLLVGTGVYLSIAVGFIQFTKIGYWWKNTIGRIFKKSEAGEGEITPLQAVSTALASTVGTGNIAGVTGAIILGGPGAVFWMWVSALFGMVTKFSEVTLAVKYRERNEKGDWCGGPMYYIKNGLGPKWKWLGGVFAVLGAIAAFGIGNIAQVHSIADSVKSVAIAFNENAASKEKLICLITGICVAAFVALVLHRRRQAHRSGHGKARASHGHHLHRLRAHRGVCQHYLRCRRFSPPSSRARSTPRPSPAARRASASSLR